MELLTFERWVWRSSVFRDDMEVVSSFPYASKLLSGELAFLKIFRRQAVCTLRKKNPALCYINKRSTGKKLLPDENLSNKNKSQEFASQRNYSGFQSYGNFLFIFLLKALKSPLCQKY